MDSITRGRYEAVARDLRALSRVPALRIFDALAARASTLEVLDGWHHDAAGGLAALLDAGLARVVAIDGEGPDAACVYGLTPRGRDAYMALRGWFR